MVDPATSTAPAAAPAHARTHGCEHCPGSHTGELPCLATATTKARSWLLIEHPGPWPRKIEDLADPEPIVAAVRAAARLGIRPQLIRRPGRRRAGGPIQVYAGRSDGADVWLEGRAVDDPAELAELIGRHGQGGLDLGALACGERPGFGAPVDEPVLLVCTHGRRNACCARTGAPLARTLATAYGDLVWETSHVGGDRFAANLVCLPHGLYYGQLGAGEAVTAVEAYLRGEVVLDRWRGRAGLSEPAQAADHFIREHTGTYAVDATHVESVTGAGPYEAVVRVGNDRYAILVNTRPASGCVSGCEQDRNTYRVEGVSLLNPVTLV